MTSSSKTTMLDSILKLWGSGFSVIPSGGEKDGKSPLVPWKKYQDSVPTETIVRNWGLTLHPKLWGIVTNSHVAVIDADTPEARAELTTELGEPHVITPRGGAHWYINTTGHPMKTVAGLLPGVDVRGVGGFANIIGANAEGEYHINRIPTFDTLIPYDKLPELVLNVVDSSESAPESTSEAESDVPPKNCTRYNVRN